MIKNYPAARLAVTWPLVLGFELAAVFYALLVEGDTAPWRGRVSGWRELPRVWRQRRSTRRGAWGSLSPVRNPLRAGVRL